MTRALLLYDKGLDVPVAALQSRRPRSLAGSSPAGAPLATSVFMERPAGRFERPFYEETKGAGISLRPMNRFLGHRPLRVRPASCLNHLENFILDVLVEQNLVGDTTSQHAVQKINVAYMSLHEIPKPVSSLLSVSKWPTRRVGVAGLHALSLLSAGELDVLVTVGEIAAQQLYLQRTLDPPPVTEPPGIVLIDEVDAHLHPQWQQKVLPLYAELFPTIQFIISTHSPFVLRSLARDKSFILRLPEGHVFDEDYSAWSIDRILEDVFSVPGRWSAELETKLVELERAASTPGQEEHVVALYFELVRAAQGCGPCATRSSLSMWTPPCETGSASASKQGHKEAPPVRQVDRTTVAVPPRLQDNLTEAMERVRQGQRPDTGIYRHNDVVVRLKRLYLEKCFLCERELRTDGEVEHFLPWHQNFPERAYDWANLHWSCKDCNQRKRYKPYRVPDAPIRPSGPISSTRRRPLLASVSRTC